MPRKKQVRPGKRDGRPPTDRSLVADGLALVAAGATPEEAAEKLTASGRPISGRTLRRAAPSESSPTPPTTETASPNQSAPQPVAPASQSPPTDPLADVRVILGARNPGALRELEDGLAVLVAGGRVALASWLARAMPAHEGVDPLTAAVAGLAAAVTHAEAMPPLHPRAATILGAVSSLAARVENIAKGRPRVETRDEATARIEARRDDAIHLSLQYTREAAAKLAADREALAAWAAGELAPRAAADLRSRVDAMLSGT